MRQRPSVIKRQREQIKRERQQLKAAKRQERKNQEASGQPETDEAQAAGESGGI